MILLRYHEIALKGENRGWFEERLAINARKLVTRALGKENRPEVERRHGRVLVHAPWSPAVSDALGRVFGIASFSPMRPVPTSLDAIAAAALEEFESHAREHGFPASFRVLTRRSDKALPLISTQIDAEIGGRIKALHPSVRVDLEAPELVLGIELRFVQSFIWLKKVPGPGGLPVGTNGRLLALISGGIDSPVAALKVLRRGSPVSFLHFHGAPFVGDEVLDKVSDLVHATNRYQPDAEPLQIVPFGKIQERIALATNPKLRTLLYRRMMIRVACSLAPRSGAQALVTGESLGQVASQTVENLAAIDRVSSLPILRPLIGFDKDEIIREAKRLGTFDVSIRPGVDCCTLFADRHPAIRASLAQLEEEEKKFPLDEFAAEAAAGVVVQRV